MKSFNIILILFLFLTAGVHAEQNFYYNSNFNRGDVVTVLSENSAENFTLELVNSREEFLTDNIFFYIETNSFKGYASVIGLDSTLSAGEYTLQVKTQDGIIVYKGAILIHQNLFKKENIQLNYKNTSLRTDTDPEIVSQAVAIHEIYGTSVQKSASGSKSIISPIKNGIITSWFGDRRNFIYSDGSSSKAVHNGTDIAGPVGTEIYAGCDGKVVLSKDRIITGNSVVIEYLPGVYGVFFHMDKIYVLPGDMVSKDTVIGTLGATGLATGPHLHWEFRVGGVPVSPDPLLANGLIDNSLIMSIVSSHTAE
ncbi:MAG: M23 family metallopeptidase [Spirochaetales bacterium]|nr:M23 family metallopeptidase [Spirochaetales bacterium]